MKDKLVPDIRFPEFEGEWDRKSFQQILKPISKPVDVKEHQDYYQIGTRSRGRGIFHKDPVTGKELGNKRVFWVVPECLIFNIVFAWEGSLAVTTEAEEGKIASHRFPMYQSKQGEASIQYLKYYLGTKRGTYLLEMASPGGAGRNKTLGKDSFYKTRLPLPTFPEQQKIATFLSLVDQRLAAARRQMELLEDWKRGVIQKELKCSYPYVLLSKVLTESRITGSNGLKAKKLTVKLWGRGVKRKIDKRPGSANTNYYTRRSGQFIYSKLDFLNCAFGMIPEKLDGLESTLDLPTFDVSNEVDPIYLLEKIKQKNFYMKYGSQANGSRIARRINQDFFLSLSIRLPPLLEQKRIASIIKTLDFRMNNASQKIKYYEKWRNGLIQKILP
jgi:type I restriction enzyme S subunit